MASMNEIERLTREYAHARRILADRVQELEDKISALKKKVLPLIRASVEATAHRQAKLQAAIEESPRLFKRPRTVILHGIRVGFKKEKGKISWEDDAVVIKRIKKSFPEDWEVYIKVKESPIKDTLAQLSGEVLQKLGVKVTDDTDEVFIKATDSEIDKLVSALLKEDDPSTSSGT